MADIETCLSGLGFVFPIELNGHHKTAYLSKDRFLHILDHLRKINERTPGKDKDIHTAFNTRGTSLPDKIKEIKELLELTWAKISEEQRDNLPALRAPSNNRFIYKLDADKIKRNDAVSEKLILITEKCAAQPGSAQGSEYVMTFYPERKSNRTVKKQGPYAGFGNYPRHGHCGPQPSLASPALLAPIPLYLISTTPAYPIQLVPAYSVPVCPYAAHPSFNGPIPGSAYAYGPVQPMPMYAVHPMPMYAVHPMPMYAVHPKR